MKEFDFMSNFYVAPFEYDGKTFATVEHCFQYYKTTDKVWRKKIRAACDPATAKKFGRQCPMRKNWDGMKIHLMGRFVLAKFRQHDDLAEALIATGDRPIEEDAWWDAFWGTGKKGNGDNYMGKILMQVRKTLIDNEAGLG
jgi:ribA/ribD-fused uncharacterized protein